MINFLSSWVKNLALALIVVSILEMVLPNNKTKKYVKMVMGLYILFSIISPFMENSNKFNLDNLNLELGLENAQETSSMREDVDQTSMDNRLNEIYKEQLEKDIVQKVKEQGYEVDSCRVVAHISEEDSGIENITVKIKSKISEEDDDEGDGGSQDGIMENKIVEEIQKIQKVEISVSGNGKSQGQDEGSNSEEKSNITKTDIKIIKKFLIKEYGVSEQCLRIS